MSNIIYGNSGDHLRVTATRRPPLGTLMVFDDGQQFVAAKAGAVDLTVGKLMQEAVVDSSGHLKDLVVAVDAVTGLYPAIGATKITITNVTAAITANQFADGYMFVNTGTGAGQKAQIKSNTAESTGTGSCIITLYQHDALVTALASGSKVGLRVNPYDGVIIAPQAAVTGIPVGVTPRGVDVSVAPYFWLQVKGTCPVLTNGTVILGKAVVPSATTDGAVDVYPLNSVDASGQQPVVGWVRSVAATGEYSLVYLTLGGI